MEHTVLQRTHTEPAAHVIEDICSTYNINQDWLCFGKGDMELKEEKITMINELTCMFEKLDINEQKAVINMIKTMTKK